MKRRSLAIVMGILVSVAAQTARAASSDAEDSDIRMTDAKVVEVNSRHISVIARTGVEHVIATDAADTHVVRKGRRVKFKEVKVGDVVTVELDAVKPVKFARHIIIGEQPARGDVASARR